jgi:integrase
MKIQLPNGCSHSKLSVNPKEWQTKKASVKQDWFINYRFYDSRYPNPKQVKIQGMNAFKILSERQAETQKLLDNELVVLKKGFNPFNKENDSDGAAFPFINALNLAFDKLTISELTKRDIKTAIGKFEKAIVSLGWKQLPVSTISRKHVRLILDNSSKSEDSFNKNRSYLMILFSTLCELEIIPVNYTKDIKKKKVVKKIRATLSQEERRKVDAYLKINYPEFHRFLHIFFHSGARITEMMRVKVSDIELDNHRFKVLIKKGSSYHEVWKTIKLIALPYWKELLEGANCNYFAFSKGLKPGGIQIEAYQINKRWYRLVKKQLGITADFYSLKHLHTTEVVEYLSDIEAAKHNSHTSTAMVNSIYDVNGKARQNNRIKELKNSF